MIIFDKEHGSNLRTNQGMLPPLSEQVEIKQIEIKNSEVFTHKITRFATSEDKRCGMWPDQ